MVSASATTLITFMLRTPPNTSSVKLLGSWDNFSKEYTMERDTRIGADHWRGCHVFTNIICDGNLTATQPGRDGGLKMGGTYWYYYRLDNDVDYYDEAEPWTTSCPLLPGQPINVLNVPIHLPSIDTRRHKRETSMASQRSIPQTMNPDDKYLNPRPPPRPKLPRLLTSTGATRIRDALTSPILASPQHPVHGRSASHPRELAERRRLRVPAKLNLDMSPSSESSTRSNALRTALWNFKPPRSGGKDEDNGKPWRMNESESNRGNRVDYSRGRSPRGNASSPSHNWPAAARSAQNLNVPAERYGERRAVSPCGSELKSRRNRSPLRAPVRFDKSPLAAIPSRGISPDRGDSRASREELDPDDPPSLVVPCKLDIGSTVNLNEKRLPTLPNSPSSVLDEELHRIGAFRSPMLDMEALQSHFSASTAASPDTSPDSFLHPNVSHFSECSTDTDAVSPSSMTSSSTFYNDSSLSSNQSVGTSEASEPPLTDKTLPNFAGLRITDDFNLSLPRICKNDIPSSPTPVAEESLPNFRVSGLHITKKPQTAYGPVSDLKAHSHDRQVLDSGLPTPRASGMQLKPEVEAGGARLPSLHVQTMMQELMDELSYLGNMINVNGKGRH
ncbi:hypothetical protein D8B26_005596 [Coccidioides posadasii str. Silveira]|uniref:Uncharacterized protein n=2 Tax=Coccidioides posadasii TaxID=199306 RepID=E9D3Z1_COCPS|nr:conserved hypothetical protein [Coccidioides posadasii str. Silveira]KMM72425.1 hypothetical protein CPAG_08718 [Coccidioides posadasii RMSCC 3488]QVM10945.1 hypothetical protein D8B26_005596 [Coccidioides posadasii str. Silveira]